MSIAVPRNGANAFTPATITKSSISAEGESVEFTVLIRQDPLAVTLDGPTLLGLAFILILSINFVQPNLVALLVDYIKLGPGGTSSNFPGYLRISWLKLWTVRDPFKPLPTDSTTEPSVGVLNREPLPYRCGPRPHVVGIAPQRQVNQFGSRDCYLALRRIIETHGSTHTHDLSIGTSCFEKHGTGLFSRYPFNKTCQGEICHVHDSEYSLHMNLHPDDAREVLEKGWGQRHPLTSPGPFKMPVPRQFTMVYAPRNQDELRIVCRIIEAAGYWVGGKEMKLDLLGEVAE